MLNDLIVVYVESPVLFCGSVFIIGLMVGSFLNVVIHRLPIMLEREWRAQASELLAAPGAPDPAAVAAVAAVSTSQAPQPRFNLVFPRSACPACAAPITAWQNIPVVSFLALRGRCAACKNRISVRYPAVELVTGLLSAWVAWRFGFGAVTLCALVVTWALIPLTLIDFDHQLLPDGITLPLMWLGLLASIFLTAPAGSPVPVSPADAVIGAASGYVSLWLVFQAFRLITGKEGMGYGDFKLFAALGAWLGWKLLPLIILLSAGTGAVFGISMIVLRGRNRSTPIPFGPYLASAGWLAMMYGDSLMSGYMRFSGLRQ